ncbi:MAG: IreB family regulatory phosphoprotein [Clostridia bacterium]|nr:IreB family regulatory phosphoprotein [Clostridia bacterium]MBR3838804.1 IreB family regulatory phosphoprotein [Clostridia bacterium]
MDLTNTMFFVVPNETQPQVSQVLHDIYFALKEKGYNPISQLVGYVMSGDPTYITNYKNARSLITRIERDEIIEALFEFYIEENFEKKGEDNEK